MKKTWKRFLSLALVLSLLFCLVACGGDKTSGSSDDSGDNPSGEVDENGDTISSKDTFTQVSAYTDPGNYNAWMQATAQAATVTQKIMEGLVRFIDGEYVPWLAESYEWLDDLTLEVKIREGVKFHNGDTMTVDDVIWCSNKSRETASSAGAWVMVDDIVKVDETTIQYKLAYTDIDFMQALSMGHITSQSYYESVGDQGFGTAPVGTGCYMWDDYVSGDRVTLKYFEDYWGEHGTINTIIIRFISENSQALIELESGNVDWITADGSSVASVEGNDAIAVVPHGNGLSEYCGFNFNSEKVLDLRVRQALSYAIDRQNILDGAREGIGEIAWGLVPAEFTNEYNEEVKNYYQHDPDKAAELLADMGYSTDNPLTLKLLTDTSAARTLEAQQIMNMANEVGFDIQIQTFESATVTSILAGGDPNDYDLFIRALGQQTSTTHQMGTIFSCAATEVGNNPFWFTRDSVEGLAEFDDLFQEIKRTTDDEARYEMMKELQIMERELVLTCWLVNQVQCEAISSNLRGYIVTPGLTSHNGCYYVE